MKVFRYKEAKEKILSLQKVALILEIKSFKKMIRIAILNFWKIVKHQDCYQEAL